MTGTTSYLKPSPKPDKKEPECNNFSEESLHR